MNFFLCTTGIIEFSCGAVQNVFLLHYYTRVPRPVTSNPFPGVVTGGGEWTPGDTGRFSLGASLEVDFSPCTSSGFVNTEIVVSSGSAAT
jgi:hypothetical protein